MGFERIGGPWASEQGRGTAPDTTRREALSTAWRERGSLVLYGQGSDGRKGRGNMAKGHWGTSMYGHGEKSHFK